MRTAPSIQSLWSAGGPFVGDDGQANSVVTVQEWWSESDPYVVTADRDHVIHPTVSAGTGNFGNRGLPIRWYQKFDNSQEERVVPNIGTVQIDRSIDTDAATCTITMSNQWMRDNEDPEAAFARELGIPGYFTPQHGVSPDAQARWGHAANEWEDVLVPNAILRTYQGYGGAHLEWSEAVDQGYIILTGVWLIDEVRLSTDGVLTITCRDMAKLLIEQQLYPPLVPSDKYPLKYYRYTYETREIAAAAVTTSKTTTTTSGGQTITAGRKRTVFRDSAVDRWYQSSSPGSDIDTGGFLLHGHKGSHCLDGRLDTYCLSVGNSGPDKPFATDWWEFSCGEWMNSIYMHPWGGNYTLYISVMENGKWQGSKTVPYDPSSLFGSQPYAVDTGADIPYVASFGVPWESGRVYTLPRAYKADRVRVSFRHHTLSQWGPWYYRCGMREFYIRAASGLKTPTSSSTTTTTTTTNPWFWAGDSLRDPTNLNRMGYITSSQMGQIDAFGDCRIYPRTGGDDPTSAAVYWIRLTSSGDGYWVLRGDGALTCYGNAPFFGSPKTLGIGNTGGGDVIGGKWQFVAPTPTNQGYWCVALDGRIRAFGDATDLGSNLPGFTYSANVYVSGGYSLKSGMGLYASITNGTVIALGDADHFGNWAGTPSDSMTCVVPNMDGTGYWLLDNGGEVQAKGACQHWGQEIIPNVDGDPREIFDQMFATASDEGYWLLRGIGNIYAFGDAENFGSPIPGTTGTLRLDGNYLDYTDIIKDLALWSGFLAFDPDWPGSQPPPIWGGLESTGAYSTKELPDELFDKRPVIDAMTELKETVGYLLFVDDQGRIRFESPNWWVQGNFDEDGNRVNFLPEVDEAVNMTDYSISLNDESLRSLIIISSEDPDIEGTTTVATKITPQTASGLKGLLVPAMWINGWFNSPDEQRLMAELISLHIWFQQRVGQVSCAANPCIQINDQVRIYERLTSETYMHYVRGVSTTHNLEEGDYMMTLTTNWLGSAEGWAITDDELLEDDPSRFVVSRVVADWINNLPSSRVEGFGDKMDDPTWYSMEPQDTELDGAGPT